MLFLNKAVRSMSKRELMATVGYLALKYGIVEQPIPPHKSIGRENDKNKKKRKTQEITTTDRRTVKTSEDARMDSSRLG